jgi:hypothetical protein
MENPERGTYCTVVPAGGMRNAPLRADDVVVRELEATLQQFGEFLLRDRLVKEKAAPSWRAALRPLGHSSDGAGHG